MKRKIISLILIFTLIITAMPFTGIDFSDIFALKVSAEEAENFMWGDYECKIINTNEVEIVLYWGTDTEVIIPSEINGMPVTSIGKYSFHGYRGNNMDNNYKIETVVIPSSVKTIGTEAFGVVDCLKNVILNEGLEKIEKYAFYDCPLLTEIKLPDSLSSIAMSAFQKTGVEELTLGPNIKGISIEAFDDTNIKKVTMNAETNHLSKNTTEILNCKIEEIVCNGRISTYTSGTIIPLGSVKKIICNGGIYYSDLLFLLKFGFDPYYNELDGSVVFSKKAVEMPEEYENNGFRYYINEKNEAIISHYVGGESVIEIPEALDGHTVTTIGTLAFAGFSEEYLDDYHIPDTLITSVTVPETVTRIGLFAFSGNAALESISLPNSITEISQECFTYCTALKSIVLPESVTEIGYGAFIACEALETIEMPGVTKIGAKAFIDCLSLKYPVFSEKLEEIEKAAFANCDALETIDLSSVTKLGSFTFQGCQGLKSVVLNDNIEHLGEYTFHRCISLKNANIPSKIVTIGVRCFEATKITEAVFGENLKTIETFAFRNCKQLANVVFPEGIESIWYNAFYNTAITTLTIPKSVKNLGYGAFSACANLETLYFYATNCRVSDNGIEYNTENWKNTSPFAGCNIKNIYLGPDVTALSWESMGYGTFEDCTVLETITIPDSVNEIGTAAFKNCSNLETAVISDSVTEIADDAFEGCDNLIIYCSETSYAFAYASAQGIRVSTFIIEAIPNQTYTGSKIEPKLSVSVSNGKLSENIDYSVSYSNNINAGEAKVRITGIGDYDKFASVASFTIVTRSISSAKVADVSAQNYTGKEIKPSLVITYNGKVLKEETDYKLQYFNNKSIGTATVYIVGIGNFSGTDSVNFSIEDLSPTQIFLNALISFFNSFFARFAAILN